MIVRVVRRIITTAPAVGISSTKESPSSWIFWWRVWSF